MARAETLALRIRAIAYDEHASIVAFSRTLAALAALGAPLGLLRSTARALADEIEHADLAFQLLDQLDPRHRGERPGSFEEALTPLPSIDRLRAELIIDTVRGGCAGETASAIDASERASLDGPERARDFFQRIAADEARHAALAFETLAWLAGADEELWALAESTLDELEAVDVRESPEGATLVPVLSTVVRPLLQQTRRARAA